MFFSIQLSVSFLYSVFNEHSPLSSSPFLPLGIPEFSDNFVCQPLLLLRSKRWLGCRHCRLVATTRRINAYAWVVPSRFRAWWAQVDSNHRPPAYQAGALTS